MIVSFARWFPLMIVALLTAGCQEKPAAAVSTVDPDADVKANLAKLDPADQQLAERQKHCPVMPEVRLGEMGTPLKIVVKGEPMFVCCKSCMKLASEEPDKTLAQLKVIQEARAQELKQQAPASPGK
jgi:hypothetical protein